MRSEPGGTRRRSPGGRVAAWAATAVLIGCVSAPVGSPSASASPIAIGADGRFAIAGNVAGLYPGSVATLMLTVTNPLHRSITVTSIVTWVGPASAQCGASYVNVGIFTGPLHVRGGDTASATVPVTMSHAAPDACQGAVFPFVYRGLGTGGP